MLYFALQIGMELGRVVHPVGRSYLYLRTSKNGRRVLMDLVNEENTWTQHTSLECKYAAVPAPAAPPHTTGQKKNGNPRPATPRWLAAPLGYPLPY